MRPPTRRHVLVATGGLLAGTAGCTDVRLAGSGTDDREVTVTDLDYRTAFFYPAYPDAAGIVASEDEQFVFAVAETDAAVTADDFELVVDGDTYASTRSPGGVPMDDIFGGWNADEWPAEPYAEGSGLLAFGVPRSVGPVERAELRAEADGRSGRWEFPDDRAGALGQPPETSASLSLPDEIVWESRFDAEMTVTNDGGRRGEFAALFGVQGSEHPVRVRLPVEAGAERTIKVEGRLPSPAGGGTDGDGPPEEVTYVLDRGFEVITDTAPVVEE